MDIGADLERAFRDGYERCKLAVMLRAEWVYDEEMYTHHCSNCGHEAFTYFTHKDDWVEGLDGDWHICETRTYANVVTTPFCPWCGAKMKEVVDEYSRYGQ